VQQVTAKVCHDCNAKNGAVGCDHWEQWPDNLNKAHNWKSGVGLDKKTHCLECGLEATIPQLASGQVSSLNCPRYKVQRAFKKPDDSRPRGYRLWCTQHKPGSAQKMPNDPRAGIQPGEAQCEKPGCNKPASWEY
jgi:hypothetical protein